MLPFFSPSHAFYPLLKEQSERCAQELQVEEEEQLKQRTQQAPDEDIEDIRRSRNISQNLLDLHYTSGSGNAYSEPSSRRQS
ncbi:unnamed protein product [Acanthoscelides obtectus]|uniref:Uncharacterized protein n=1 Tax=Acanthoscelides obtectus TaxID=200917 RepID=A0A9P0KEP7_ACAOB|nr:unnamed protein product [Acanthoscelides obtectus]CAK1647662.1 hypothetical protein AOBTE_LOCUS15325 [Acanthoscelides obtectus]